MGRKGKEPRGVRTQPKSDRPSIRSHSRFLTRSYAPLSRSIDQSLSSVAAGGGRRGGVVAVAGAAIVVGGTCGGKNGRLARAGFREGIAGGSKDGEERRENCGRIVLAIPADPMRGEVLSYHWGWSSSSCRWSWSSGTSWSCWRTSRSRGCRSCCPV